MYDEKQSSFLNAVAKIATEESPEKVLDVLQNIETELKKNPPHRFGPRTIDLDLLLYGEEHIKREGIEVPHPRMHERRFVLEPLCELTDEESWAECLNGTQEQICKKTAIRL